MKVKSESEVAQSCLTPHDPIDCSPPGPSVRGIFQAILKWVAIAFTNLDSILKSRTINFANKGPSGQGYGFSSCMDVKVGL